MKKSVFFSRLMMLMLTLNTVVLTAQTEVPKAVQKTFSEKFSNAEDVYWDEFDGQYTAYFYSGDYSMEAYFSQKGEWTKSSTSIEFEELPTSTQVYITKNFGAPEYFSNISKVENPEKMIFTVSFETAINLVDLEFDNTGKLLKKNVEKIDIDE